MPGKMWPHDWPERNSACRGTKNLFELGFRVGRSHGGGQLFFWRVFFGSYNYLIATGLLKSDARQDW